MTKTCSCCGKTKPSERFPKLGKRCRLCLSAAKQCYDAGIYGEAKQTALHIVDNIEREVNGWTAADKDWIS